MHSLRPKPGSERLTGYTEMTTKSNCGSFTALRFVLDDKL